MTSELMGTLIFATGSVLVIGMLCGSALVAWTGWLKLKRLEMQAARKPVADDAVPDADGDNDTGVLIEVASMKERLRRLEAIASGVEL